MEGEPQAGSSRSVTYRKNAARSRRDFRRVSFGYLCPKDFPALEALAEDSFSSPF